MKKPHNLLKNVCANLFCVMTLLGCLPKEDIPGQGGNNGGKEDKDNVYSVVYYPGEAGNAYYRIPSICRTKDGTLLAFAEARVESKDDDSNIDIVVKRSLDNGRSMVFIFSGLGVWWG